MSEEVEEVDLTLPPPEITFEKLTGDNILTLTFSELMIFPNNITEFNSTNGGEEVIMIEYIATQETKD